MRNGGALRVIGLCLLMLAIGGGTSWILGQMAEETEPEVVETPHTFVAAEQGEVSNTSLLTAFARWDIDGVGINRAPGTVTAVLVEPGQEVGSGEVLYRVDEEPVTVAAGSVPAYRPLALGTSGADVEQLQQLLTDLGHYTGAVNGTFGPAVENAVRAWKQELGVTVDGVVRLGEVVFVPTLPFNVVLNADVIAVGNLLSGGEPAVGAMPEAPTVTVNLGFNQMTLINPGTPVTLTGQLEGVPVVWESVGGPLIETDTGTAVVLLPVDRELICGDECHLISLGFATRLEATVITVPRTVGVVVPSAALVTTADGSTAVVDESGNTVGVTVVATSRGRSVVEGLAEGTRVRVPGG